MRLPRWFVVGLLTTSLSAVIGAGIWWWITWPQRTAYDFLSRIRVGDTQGARELMPRVGEVAENLKIVSSKLEPLSVTFAPREVLEIVQGRIRFRIRDVWYQFQVTRGTVTGTWDGWEPPGTSLNAANSAGAAAGWSAPLKAKEWSE